MSADFYFPTAEKMSLIKQTIEVLQDLVFACSAYRNCAIEHGATKEDLEFCVCDYVEQDFDSRIQFIIKDLCVLHLSEISSLSFQPKVKPSKVKELTKAIQEIGDTLDDTKERFISNILRTEGHVSVKEKCKFIDLFIYGDRYEFPVEEVKERILHMDYQDFLKTPYWKSIAYFVKAEAGGKCSVCGATKTLEVHHLTYDNHGDELHHLDDLVCVCKKCHENQHKA